MPPQALDKRGVALARGGGRAARTTWSWCGRGDAAADARAAGSAAEPAGFGRAGRRRARRAAPRARGRGSGGRRRGGHGRGACGGRGGRARAFGGPRGAAGRHPEAVHPQRLRPAPLRRGADRPRIRRPRRRRPWRRPPPAGCRCLRARRPCASDAHAGEGGAHVVAAVGEDGAVAVEARAVVLATGSRERGLGALDVAGSRPAGVHSGRQRPELHEPAGLFARAARGGAGVGRHRAHHGAPHGVPRGAGGGRIRDHAAPLGLRRNIVQCLDDFGIPLHLSSTVVRLEGEGRLSAVYVARVDPDTRQVVPGNRGARRVRHPAPFGGGFCPRTRWRRRRAWQLDEATGGPRVDNRLRTNVEGIFACGNALHIHDLVDYASAEGELAGRAAAACALAGRGGPAGDAADGAGAAAAGDAPADAGAPAAGAPAGAGADVPAGSGVLAGASDAAPAASSGFAAAPAVPGGGGRGRARRGAAGHRALDARRRGRVAVFPGGARHPQPPVRRGGHRRRRGTCANCARRRRWLPCRPKWCRSTWRASTCRGLSAVRVSAAGGPARAGRRRAGPAARRREMGGGAD